MDDLLGVKITHSNTVHEKRPYTIYEIEVRSSSTITWIIYKRYSAFDDLHELLQKFLLSNPSTASIKLPQLPPKRITRLLAVEFVEKRRNELQDYLRSCLQIPALLHSDIMLNFLEAPDSVRPMLQRQSAPQQQGSSAGNKAGTTSGGTMSSTDATRFATNTPEEKQVLDLLSALKTSPNKVAALRQFETWFFRLQTSSTRTRLSAEYIRLLFEGHSEGKDGKPIASGSTGAAAVTASTGGIGLVYVCGDFRHSRCAARAALYLICRLLDQEKNKESAAYIEQFASLSITQLQRLRLHNHIFSSRGNRPAAFTVIHILQTYIENKYSSLNAGANGTGQVEITLELLVQEAWARQEYLKWLRVKNAASFQATTTVNENFGNLALSLRGNTLTAYKPLIQSGFQQLLQVCSKDSGWFDVNLSDSAGKQSMSSEFDRKGDPNPNIPSSIPSIPPTPLTRGPSLDFSSNTPQTPATVDSSQIHISLSYQKDEENSLILLRSCVLVPFSVQEVSSILTVPDLLPLWDEKIHSARVTQQFDPSSDILHLVYHTSLSFYHQKDMSLLRSTTQLQDGTVILLYRSVNIPSCGEVNGYQRCMLYPSGYIISPIGPPDARETLITLILQLDSNSVLLYSSDLLGESQDIKLSWYNLINLLAENR